MPTFQVNTSTKMIRIADLSYPRYIYDMRKEFPNVSFSDNWSQPETITDWGYEYVWPTTRPVNDVVLEGQPVQGEDGLWYQTWTDREYTPEEIANNLANAKYGNIVTAQDIVNTQFQQNITPVEYNTESYGVNLRPEDITTLLAVKSLAEDQVVSEPFTLRLYQGSLTGTAAEIIGLINAVLVVYYGIQRRAWDYMVSVEQATTLEDIPPVPDTFLN